MNDIHLEAPGTSHLVCIVSRYMDDGEIEQEPAHEDPKRAPPKDWPRQGTVEFRDVTMAYRKDLPPVLNNINVNLRAGEKIGVVGRFVKDYVSFYSSYSQHRTGAGKSSLLVCLYRIVELSKGAIIIDG